MKNKSLLISIFVTMFLVVIAGGVATSVLANNQTNGKPKIDAAKAVSTYQAREAEYQALLAQANSELEQANQQITDLANKISAITDGSTYPVSSDSAMSVAFEAAGDYPLSVPELVNFNGTAAYEVRFEKGNIYVDATSGTILYNTIASSAAQSISAEQAARLAVAYIGNGDIRAIDVTTYNGSRVYRFTFANGQVVYVSLAGKIVAIKMPSRESSSSGDESHVSDSTTTSQTEVHESETPEPSEVHASETPEPHESYDD